MELKPAQQTFLRDQFHSLTLQATVQRAKVYASQKPERAPAVFRASLRHALEDTAPHYNRSVADPEHVQHIADLADHITAKHAGILRGGRFRIGPA
ncbi:MAG: hypothetical protein V3U35_00325, partial [Candidatus Neomarinimicrobiota bacterium]